MSALARGGPLDELERRHLQDLFAELCRIESPSGRERACARRIAHELQGLGIEVHEDDAGTAAGANCGNLLARLPHSGPGEWGEHGAVLLCAHMDTVPLQAPVEPVLSEGVWENAHDGILGADNKAAVAVLLALARRLHRERPAAGAVPPVPGEPAGGGAPDVELLFTVGEERSLAGARAFDASALRSRVGYVFDHASPVGEVVVAAPNHHRVQADFHGRAAHAGVRPEQGRSAILAAARAVADMPLGRVDAETTANVGTISGGSAINVVPEYCSVLAEVRSLSPERAQEVLGEVLACVHEAANLPECECDVDVTVEHTFAGYRLAPSTPAVRAAEAALRACGHEPVRIASGGASDANALIPAGVQVVNLANGTERNHEPGERVAAAALEAMLEVALALPAALAAALAQE